MDALDRRILSALQSDATLTMNQLAEVVNSTPATCHRRFQQLCHSGVITDIVAMVDFAASKEPFTVVLGIMVESQKPHEQATARRFLQNHPHIKQCWMTTGEFDYVVVAAFLNSDHYKEFVHSELTESVNIRNFRSYISLDTVKFDTSRSFE